MDGVRYTVENKIQYLTADPIMPQKERVRKDSSAELNSNVIGHPSTLKDLSISFVISKRKQSCVRMIQLHIFLNSIIKV